MTTLIYAWNRFYTALGTTALGDKPVRERLLEAVTNQLDVIVVSPDIQGLPEEQQECLTRLHTVLIEKGSHQEIVSAMVQIQVVQVIEEIMSLFHDISMVFGRSK